MNIILDEKEKKLLEAAKQASKLAYSPYSLYKVGSAILTETQEIIAGCNIENSSYSLSICAERTALFKAVSKGFDKFEKIAIYVDYDKIFYPCGACRQVLAEFNKNITIILASRNEVLKTSLGEIFTNSFSL